MNIQQRYFLNTPLPVNQLNQASLPNSSSQKQKLPLNSSLRFGSPLVAQFSLDIGFISCMAVGLALLEMARSFTLNVLFPPLKPSYND